MLNQFKIKGLHVSINERIILKDVNLSLKNGDILALIGPNGSGKSTLLKTIMHHFTPKIVAGNITFNQKSLNNLSTYEIARLGIFYIDQAPIELQGVPMIEFLKEIIRIHNPKASLLHLYQNINSLFDDLSLDKSLLSNDVNVGFSGGQKKKSEIIQSQLLNAKVLLFDEIDAGLDVDAIKKIQVYINKNRLNHIFIIVSHDLDFFYRLKPNKVAVLSNQTIAKTGGLELIEEIQKNGYKSYEKATKPITDAYKF